jgi:hypothetical protein
VALREASNVVEVRMALSYLGSLCLSVMCGIHRSE